MCLNTLSRLWFYPSPRILPENGEFLDFCLLRRGATADDVRKGKQSAEKFRVRPHQSQKPLKELPWRPPQTQQRCPRHRQSQRLDFYASSGKSIETCDFSKTSDTSDTVSKLLKQSYASSVERIETDEVSKTSYMVTVLVSKLLNIVRQKVGSATHWVKGVKMCVENLLRHSERTLNTVLVTSPTKIKSYFQNYINSKHRSAFIKSRLHRSGDVARNPGPLPQVSNSVSVTTYNVRGLKDEGKMRHLLNLCYKGADSTNSDSFYLMQETYLGKPG